MCGNMQVVRTLEYIASVEWFIFKSNCTRNRLRHLSKYWYLIRIGFYNVRKCSYIPSHDHNVRNCGTLKKKVLWNDDVCYALYQHTELDLYCTIMSLTQKSTDRHVTTFGHTMLTPRQHWRRSLQIDMSPHSDIISWLYYVTDAEVYR
jgi:hypothetical protein